MLLLLSLMFPGEGIAQSAITGTIRDRSGAAIANATVTAVAGKQTRTVQSADDGSFTVPIVSSPAIIRVSATGFAMAERAISPGDAPITVVLQSTTRTEQVIVTATRTPLPASETGASVNVVSSEQLRTSAGVTLDDTLRQVPGFSLFRRSSTITANPTTAGVSLRGIGSSGASRALVLLDGTPISDPFGGWIYWDQVPQLAISGVEVVRGGSSGLYGTDALSGVVNLISRRPENNFLEIEAALGNTFLRNGSAVAGLSKGKWHALGAVQAFDTDGFFIVPSDQRGSVDTPANVEYRTAYATLERSITTGRVFATGNLLSEARNNGTRLQLNDTHLGRIALGADFAPTFLGTVAVRLFSTGEHYHQMFSALAADRNSESLARRQTVPSQQLGGTLQWTRTVRTHALAAGLDFSERRGHTDETVYSSGSATSILDAGGRTRNIGYFLEDVFSATPLLTFTATLRGDHWTNADGRSTTTPLRDNAVLSTIRFPNRSEAAFSPRISTLYRLNNNIALTAAAYRSFRSPTLNELYRAFRVGNILTLANSDLRAERLTGGEAGVRLSARNLTTRITYFDSRISRSIANVTQSAVPSLITRQRQNLGTTSARGLEIEAEWHHRWLSLTGGYQLTDARVDRFPANRTIEGLRIPQVPRHQFTAQALCNASRWTFSTQLRAAGVQFEDDQNQLPLESYVNLDTYVSRDLSRALKLYLAAENVLHQRAMVGRTPTVTLGPPALVRLGVRFHLGD